MKLESVFSEFDEKLSPTLLDASSRTSFVSVGTPVTLLLNVMSAKMSSME